MALTNLQVAIAIAIALVVFRRVVIKAVIAILAIGALALIGTGAAALAGMLH